MYCPDHVWDHVIILQVSYRTCALYINTEMPDESPKKGANTTEECLLPSLPPHGSSHHQNLPVSGAVKWAGRPPEAFTQGVGGEEGIAGFSQKTLRGRGKGLGQSEALRTPSGRSNTALVVFC